MPQVVLDVSRIAVLFSQEVAAAVPEHMRVYLHLQPGFLTGTADNLVDCFYTQAVAPLGRENEIAVGVKSFKAQQRLNLIWRQRMIAALTAFETVDVNHSLVYHDCIPLKGCRLTRSQPVPKHQ